MFNSVGHVEDDRYIELKTIKITSYVEPTGEAVFEQVKRVPEVVQRIFDCFDELYKKIPFRIRKRVEEVNKLISDTIGFVSATYEAVDKIYSKYVKRVANPAADASSVFRHVNGLLTELDKGLKFLEIASSVIKLFNIIKSVIAIKNLAVNIYKLALDIIHGLGVKIATRCLKISSNLSNLTEGIALFISGLAELAPVIATTAVQLAVKVIFFVSLIFSISSLVLEVRNLIKMMDYEDNLKIAFDHGGFNAVEKFLSGAEENISEKTKGRLEKRFDVGDGRLFLAQVRDIFNTGDEKTKLDCVEALNQRVATKELSHLLNILSAAISTVAIIIIFAAPPLLPLAVTMLAFTSALNLGNGIGDIIRRWQFEESMDKCVPKATGEIGQASQYKFDKWKDENKAGLDQIKNWQPRTV